MESWETELCSKLYKTRKEQQIFLGFRILKQEGNSKQSKIFLVFSSTKQKLEGEAN
jgi:hypothetical protein